MGPHQVIRQGSLSDACSGLKQFVIIPGEAALGHLIERAPQSLKRQRAHSCPLDAASEAEAPVRDRNASSRKSPYRHSGGSHRHESQHPIGLLINGSDPASTRTSSFSGIT